MRMRAHRDLRAESTAFTVLQGLQRYSIDSKTTSIISTLRFLPVGPFYPVLEGPFCAQ